MYEYLDSPEFEDPTNSNANENARTNAVAFGYVRLDSKITRFIPTFNFSINLNLGNLSNILNTYHSATKNNSEDEGDVFMANLDPCYKHNGNSGVFGQIKYCTSYWGSKDRVRLQYVNQNYGPWYQPHKITFRSQVKKWFGIWFNRKADEMRFKVNNIKFSYEDQLNETLKNISNSNTNFIYKGELYNRHGQKLEGRSIDEINFPFNHDLKIFINANVAGIHKEIELEGSSINKDLWGAAYDRVKTTLKDMGKTAPKTYSVIASNSSHSFILENQETIVHHNYRKMEKDINTSAGFGLKFENGSLKYDQGYNSPRVHNVYLDVVAAAKRWGVWKGAHIIHEE